MADNQIDIQLLKEQFLKGAAVILDVRENKEWAAGHLQGAIHCPIKEIESHHLPTNLPRNKPIYCHCAVGGRAKRAALMLKAEFPDIHFVTYGIDQFRQAGFPVEQ